MADKSGKRGEKTGEKSNFSVTCSRLSKYLKEKGSFGDIGFGIAPRPLEQAKEIIQAPTSIMSQKSRGATSAEVHTRNGSEQTSPKSMDLFPRNAGFDSLAAPAKKESSIASNNKEIEKNQLTIFYSGKVLVFDNFPAEKVEELMQMASKESLVAKNFCFTNDPSSTTAARVEFPHQHSSNTASNSSSQPLMIQTSMPKPAQSNASDMPIARKNSLHRFLEKRKDRISTKAPYQVNASSSVAAEVAKPEDNKSWLNLGRPVSKPEQSFDSRVER